LEGKTEEMQQELQQVSEPIDTKAKEEEIRQRQAVMIAKDSHTTSTTELG